MATPETDKVDAFEGRTQVIVRAVICVVLVAVYAVLTALGLSERIAPGFEILVGAAFGYFVGGGNPLKK